MGYGGAVFCTIYPSPLNPQGLRGIPRCSSPRFLCLPSAASGDFLTYGFALRLLGLASSELASYPDIYRRVAIGCPVQSFPAS